MGFINVICIIIHSWNLTPCILRSVGAFVVSSGYGDILIRHKQHGPLIRVWSPLLVYRICIKANKVLIFNLQVLFNCYLTIEHVCVVVLHPLLPTTTVASWYSITTLINAEVCTFNISLLSRVYMISPRDQSYIHVLPVWSHIIICFTYMWMSTACSPWW